MGKRRNRTVLKAGKLQNVNNRREPTFPSWAPKKELDFILCSEDIKIKDYKVLRNTLSDHLPILLDFEIKKN